MSNLMIKAAVRTLFTFTSREKALERSKILLGQYLRLTEGWSEKSKQLCVEVPPMRGVDEDMRRWSFFMILEHNAIVNRSITASVVQLANGELLNWPATIDVKKGVMPSGAADEAQVGLFADSVTSHVAAVENLKQLRGTATSPHPIFGQFDAHKWSCMFAFHLGLHLPQAKYVAGRVKAEQNEGADHALSRG